MSTTDSPPDQGRTPPEGSSSTLRRRPHASLTEAAPAVEETQDTVKPKQGLGKTPDGIGESVFASSAFPLQAALFPRSAVSLWSFSALLTPRSSDGSVQNSSDPQHALQPLRHPSA
jgi:hypothetical protein